MVAFNRERSLRRLLQSLESAHYPKADIELFISIDYAADNADILKIADNFSWNHGKKSVIYHRENLGLRKHILTCGDLSIKHGSIIILEDDLFVSPDFYNYAIQALKFSEDKESIGGISLYNHQLNVHTLQNFSPFEDGFDNWYFQFASSWGQAYSKAMWEGFMNWYQKTSSIDNETSIPAYVRSWSEKSWLKYNIAYLIVDKKFFLYPKVSLTTNFSDAGTHVGNDSTIYQVPLMGTKNKKYSFSLPEESSSTYDAYYENMGLSKVLGINEAELTVDLYGYQNQFSTRYVLSPNILNYRIIKSYGKSLKPRDANIIYNIAGNELFLYDLQIDEKNENKTDQHRAILYDHKQIHPLSALKIVVKYGFGRFKRLFSMFSK